MRWDSPPRPLPEPCFVYFIFSCDISFVLFSPVTSHPVRCSDNHQRAGTEFLVSWCHICHCGLCPPGSYLEMLTQDLELEPACLSQGAVAGPSAPFRPQLGASMVPVATLALSGSPPLGLNISSDALKFQPPVETGPVQLMRAKDTRFQQCCMSVSMVPRYHHHLQPLTQ